MWEMRRKGQRAEDGSERRALHSVQMKDGCIQDRNAPRGKKIKSATLWPRRRSTKTGEQTRENTSRLVHTRVQQQGRGARAWCVVVKRAKHKLSTWGHCLTNEKFYPAMGFEPTMFVLSRVEIFVV